MSLQCVIFRSVNCQGTCLDLSVCHSNAMLLRRGCNHSEFERSVHHMYVLSSQAWRHSRYA